MAQHGKARTKIKYCHDAEYYEKNTIVLESNNLDNSITFFLTDNLGNIQSTRMNDKLVYPNARRDENVVDDYHGIKVQGRFYNSLHRKKHMIHLIKMCSLLHVSGFTTNRA